jgi:hypothetical protein
MKARDWQHLDSSQEFTTFDVEVVSEIDCLRRLWEGLRETQIRLERSMRLYHESRKLLDQVNACARGRNASKKPCGTSLPGSASLNSTATSSNE